MNRNFSFIYNFTNLPYLKCVKIQSKAYLGNSVSKNVSDKNKKQCIMNTKSVRLAMSNKPKEEISISIPVPATKQFR